jgi:hypothetical protein
MTTSKIIGGNGFNEGLPQDEFRYGITEYEKISAGAATQELRAAVAGRQIEVLSYVFVVDAASTVTFKSNTTAITGGMELPANGGASAVSADEQGLMITEKGEALNITNSAGNIAGHVTYRIV